MAQPRRAATALIAVQTLWWASIALPGYFRTDDFFYMRAADGADLWDFLGRIYWEHFAPGHRLAFWLIGTATPGHWALLQLLLIATFAGGLVCFYLTLELLFGRSWWLLVPLAITGFAWQFSFGFAWPSAGLQVIPEFALGMLCIYAFLRHLESGRRTWLAVAALVFAIGLSFYIRMLLVPVVLVLIRVLFLQRDLSLRAVARMLWAERVRWLVFLVPAALYLSVFWQKHALESPPPDSAGQVVHFLGVVWLRNVAPGFLGVRMDAGGASFWQAPHELATWKMVAEVVAQIVVLAMVWLAVSRKRAAVLRPLAYLAIVAGVTFWLTARGKVGVGGPGVGYDQRYVSNLCWLLPLGAVFALHPRRVLELGAPWPEGERRARPVPIAALACALLATVLFAAHSSRTRLHDWRGEQARTWVQNVRNGLNDARVPGSPARVRDGTAPDYVNAGTYAETLPLLGVPVEVDPTADAVVLPDGHVRRPVGHSLQR